MILHSFEGLGVAERMGQIRMGYGRYIRFRQAVQSQDAVEVSKLEEDPSTILLVKLSGQCNTPRHARVCTRMLRASITGNQIFFLLITHYQYEITCSL
jgi:hypothetical protein